MKICVVGTGYVGLVTGACLSEMGNIVTCVDIDEKKINMLNDGKIPIYEPGLTEIVVRNKDEERLFFTTEIAEGLKNSDFCFIAVGTPSKQDGSADLTGVLNVAQQIGKKINNDIIVVNKSTVPVGTGDKVKDIVLKEIETRGKKHLNINVISNPEFLKEGAAIEDFMRPDRIIVGVYDQRPVKKIEKLYEPFIRNMNPLIIMDVRSAELSKYAANAMLATRISFMNDLANLCDKVGANISDIRKGIGTDSRIGSSFLYAGIGYGGSCFPKDVKELLDLGKRNQLDLKVVKSVEEVNDEQKRYIVKKVIYRFGDDLNNKVFGIWGLAFKPQTDDMRESPSIVVINELLKRGATIKVYDPEAMKNAKKYFEESLVSYTSNSMETIDNVDALLLLTEWKEFRQPQFNEMMLRMNKPIIFDGRNQYKPDELWNTGFEYYCVGGSKFEINYSSQSTRSDVVK
jgi:UDPglucose 6-dehydrogenase